MHEVLPTIEMGMRKNDRFLLIKLSFEIDEPSQALPASMLIFTLKSAACITRFIDVYAKVCDLEQSRSAHYQKRFNASVIDEIAHIVLSFDPFLDI